MGVSLIHHQMISSTHVFLHSCILGTAPTAQEQDTECTFQGMGMGVASLNSPSPACESNGSHISP